MSRKSPFSSKIKIFLDGADRAAILEAMKDSKISGFTTNPSLMKKSGVKDYKAFCQEILTQIGGKPISFEVFADQHDEMKRQALEIHSWEKKAPIASNLYVKIPVVNSEGKSMAPLIRELATQGVKLNVTAIYTLDQVYEVCQALKGGAPSIVSVFAGRIADTGRDPIPTMQASVELCEAAGKQVECLWASTREAINIVQAEATGCHIITAPYDMIKKIPSFNKDLQQVTLDTVRTFKADAESAGFSL